MRQVAVAQAAAGARRPRLPRTLPHVPRDCAWQATLAALASAKPIADTAKQVAARVVDGKGAGAGDVQRLLAQAIAGMCSSGVPRATNEKLAAHLEVRAGEQAEIVNLLGKLATAAPSVLGPAMAPLVSQIQCRGCGRSHMSPVSAGEAENQVFFLHAGGYLEEAGRTQPSHTVSLDELLENEFAPGEVAYRCEQCGEQKATRRVAPAFAPPVVALHIDRTRHEVAAAGALHDMSERPVSYTLDAAVLPGFHGEQYNLVARVAYAAAKSSAGGGEAHRLVQGVRADGEVEGVGHFTVAARGPDGRFALSSSGSQWVPYDVPAAGDRAACLLVWEREGCRGQPPRTDSAPPSTTSRLPAAPSACEQPRPAGPASGPHAEPAAGGASSLQQAAPVAGGAASAASARCWAEVAGSRMPPERRPAAASDARPASPCRAAAPQPAAPAPARTPPAAPPTARDVRDPQAPDTPAVELAHVGAAAAACAPLPAGAPPDWRDAGAAGILRLHPANPRVAAVLPPPGVQVAPGAPVPSAAAGRAAPAAAPCGGLPTAAQLNTALAAAVAATSGAPLADPLPRVFAVMLAQNAEAVALCCEPEAARGRRAAAAGSAPRLSIARALQAFPAATSVVKTRSRGEQVLALQHASLPAATATYEQLVGRLRGGEHLVFWWDTTPAQRGGLQREERPTKVAVGAVPALGAKEAVDTVVALVSRAPGLAGRPVAHWLEVETADAAPASGGCGLFTVFLTFRDEPAALCGVTCLDGAQLPGGARLHLVSAHPSLRACRDCGRRGCTGTCWPRHAVFVRARQPLWLGQQRELMKRTGADRCRVGAGRGAGDSSTDRNFLWLFFSDPARWAGATGPLAELQRNGGLETVYFSESGALPTCEHCGLLEALPGGHVAQRCTGGRGLRVRAGDTAPLAADIRDVPSGGAAPPAAWHAPKRFAVSAGSAASGTQRSAAALQQTVPGRPAVPPAAGRGSQQAGQRGAAAPHDAAQAPPGVPPAIASASREEGQRTAAAPVESAPALLTTTAGLAGASQPRAGVFLSQCGDRARLRGEDARRGPAPEKMDTGSPPALSPAAPMDTDPPLSHSVPAPMDTAPAESSRPPAAAAPGAKRPRSAPRARRPRRGPRAARVHRPSPPLQLVAPRAVPASLLVAAPVSGRAAPLRP